MVLVDEASRVDPETFLEGIVPMMTVHGRCAVLISTPLGQDNYFTRLFTVRRADGTEMFNTIKVELVCDSCKARGAHARCVHRQQNVPHWKSRASVADNTAIINEFRPDMAATEIYGEPAEDTRRVFPEELVQRLEKAPPHRAMELGRTIPRYVVTAVDPSGGGSRSDWAMVTYYVHMGRKVVRSSAAQSRTAARSLRCPAVAGPCAARPGMPTSLRDRRPWPSAPWFPTRRPRCHTTRAACLHGWGP